MNDGSATSIPHMMTSPGNGTPLMMNNNHVTPSSETSSSAPSETVKLKRTLGTVQRRHAHPRHHRRQRHLRLAEGRARRVRVRGTCARHLDTVRSDLSDRRSVFCRARHGHHQVRRHVRLHPRGIRGLHGVLVPVAVAVGDLPGC